MITILTRAGCFVAVILLGYVLKRIRYFAPEDFGVLSRIVLRITLTGAIVTSFSGKELDASLLTLSAVGLGFGFLIMGTEFLLNRRRGKDAQAFAVLNGAGCNIGNFVMPFAQSFLGAAGVMAVSLYDVGNSIICLGGAYSAAAAIQGGKDSFSPRGLLKTIVKSVPLMTYLLMTALCLAHVTLPGPVLELAGLIGAANPFLAMLMIGIGFRLGSRERMGEVLRILIPRYALGIGLAVISYTLIPLPESARQALVIGFVSPVASAAPAYTASLGGDYELASAVNSFSILTSIVLIVAALMIMGV